MSKGTVTSGSTPLPSSRSPLTSTSATASSRSDVVGQHVAAAAEKRAGGPRADQRNALDLQRIGEDLEAAPRPLVDDRHHRLVPAHIGVLGLAVPVDEAEGRRAAEEDLGRVRRSARPSGCGDRRPARRRPSAGRSARGRSPPARRRRRRTRCGGSRSACRSARRSSRCSSMPDTNVSDGCSFATGTSMEIGAAAASRRSSRRHRLADLAGEGLDLGEGLRRRRERISSPGLTPALSAGAPS